jgi:hypothetical protein
MRSGLTDLRCDRPTQYLVRVAPGSLNRTEEFQLDVPTGALE